jgi:hypothetical protein
MGMFPLPDAFDLAELIHEPHNNRNPKDETEPEWLTDDDLDAVFGGLGGPPGGFLGEAVGEAVWSRPADRSSIAR